MATFMAVTASNQPRVTDPIGVQQVLDRYYLDGDLQASLCEDEQDDRTSLVIWGYDWPTAWQIPKGDGANEVQPDWDSDGNEGFREFLRELSPFLSEPLIVQAIGSEACRFPLLACEWKALPGEDVVRINSFEASSCVFV